VSVSDTCYIRVDPAFLVPFLDPKFSYLGLVVAARFVLGRGSTNSRGPGHETAELTEIVRWSALVDCKNWFIETSRIF